MRTRALSMALATLTVACTGAGVPDSSTTTVSSPWAAEAEAWLTSMYGAAKEGIPNVVQFLHEELVFEDRTGGWEIRGRDDFIEYAMDHLGRVDPAISAGRYLSAEGLLDHYQTTRPVAADYVDRFEVEDGLIRTLVNSGSVASGRMYDPNRRDFDAIERLADSYVSLWNDGGDAADIYAPEAQIDDTLLGLSLNGKEMIADAVGTGHWPDLPPVQIPDLPRQYAGESDREMPGGRAVFVAPSDIQPSKPDEVRMVLRVDDGSGCPGAMAVSLAWDGEKIHSEHRYHEVDSVRRCLEPERLQTGWWEGIEIPEPIRIEETVPLSWPEKGIEVRIYNGSAGVVRFVKWGLKRFDAAGLPLPRIGSVTFLTRETKCRGFSGFYSPEDDGAKITLCQRVEDVCKGTKCHTWAEGPRITLLHEYAHAWMNEFMTEDRRDPFLQFEGVPRWSDFQDPWEDRGMERAANTIALWLMFEGELTRLDDQAACRHLREGFKIITGREPIAECP